MQIGLHQVVHLHLHQVAVCTSVHQCAPGGALALAPGCSVQQGVALGIIGRLDVLKPLVMSARAAAAWLPILPPACSLHLAAPACKSAHNLA